MALRDLPSPRRWSRPTAPRLQRLLAGGLRLGDCKHRPGSWQKQHDQRQRTHHCCRDDVPGGSLRRSKREQPHHIVREAAPEQDVAGTTPAWPESSQLDSRHWAHHQCDHPPDDRQAPSRPDVSSARSPRPRQMPLRTTPCRRRTRRRELPRFILETVSPCQQQVDIAENETGSRARSTGRASRSASA